MCCGTPLHTGEEGFPGYVEPATYDLISILYSLIILALLQMEQYITYVCSVGSCSKGWCRVPTTQWVIFHFSLLLLVHV
ncbi:uncharacterized protein LOC124698019 isoform X2 [Lolium rigidum]|uniref:uncharacterized protein LOC124698019 isoform X2 n=1 Tax=Lolium rigidum TaxID=89674 RepID=UPI001F5D14B9|nr:uncharacterized protein LOC124698019 isoform X2 [Lolium rigidum]